MTPALRLCMAGVFTIAAYGCDSGPIPPPRMSSSASSSEGFASCPKDTAVVGGGYEIDPKARVAGKRIIAVGTTVLRALETAIHQDGMIYPAEGWTSLVITPDHHIRSVDGLLTGLHEPRSTHIAILAALAGFEHIRMAYEQALKEGYLWHEFGDLHLLLP